MPWLTYLLIVTTCLISCSLSMDNNKNLKLTEKSMDTSKVINLLETFPTGSFMFYGIDHLGETSASIHYEEAISKEMMEYLIEDKKTPEFKGLIFYGGEKCSLNKEVSLYTLYAVKDIPFGNVALYVFSFSKKNAKVIDVIKLASYEENEGKTLVEEGEINCDLNELIIESKTLTISSTGEFKKKIDK